MPIILFLIIFGVVVIPHEFGHLIVAKINGIKVNEFWVGFGPKLLSFTKGQTKYCLRLLPLGGACIYDMMDPVEKSEDDGKDVAQIQEEYEPGQIPFYKANVWKKIAVVAAGPVFNFILGAIVALVMVSSSLTVTRVPVASEVLTDGAGYKAGLRDGDRLVSLNGEKMILFNDLSLYLLLFDGGDIDVKYERDGKIYSTVVTPEFNPDMNSYYFGIVNKDFEEPKGLDVFKYAYGYMRYYARSTIRGLAALIKGHNENVKLSGPVGFVDMVGDTYESAKEYGAGSVVVSMMEIALMLTMNLGILNLVPIPALDGGRLLIYIIEAIRGKPLPPKGEAVIQIVGVVIILIIAVFVLFGDIRGLIKGW